MIAEQSGLMGMVAAEGFEPSTFGLWRLIRIRKGSWNLFRSPKLFEGRFEVVDDFNPRMVPDTFVSFIFRER